MAGRVSFSQISVLMSIKNSQDIIELLVLQRLGTPFYRQLAGVGGFEGQSCIQQCQRGLKPVNRNNRNEEIEERTSNIFLLVYQGLKFFLLKLKYIICVKIQMSYLKISKVFSLQMANLKALCQTVTQHLSKKCRIGKESKINKLIDQLTF